MSSNFYRCLITRFFAGAVKLSVFLFAPFGMAETEPDWFALDDKIEQVNEGDLHFLVSPPNGPIHQHENRLQIPLSALTDGWVALQQCHRNLDPNRAAQIAFHKDRVRALQVVQADNIGRAYVEDASVQLEEIQPHSVICLRAELKILHKTDSGWQMRNGPFMRRFLDGFYPLAVQLELHWPADALALGDIHPSAQPGFKAETGAGYLRIDTVFEGRLRTEINFQAVF